MHSLHTVDKNGLNCLGAGRYSHKNKRRRVVKHKKSANKLFQDMYRAFFIICKSTNESIIIINI